MAAREFHSVVVPMFREEEGAREFHRRLSVVLAGLGEYEIIYVEDHSPDATYEILCAIVQEDPRVRVVRLSRRYGHQVSLTAGMDMARGDTVTVMDGDLQHPPELLPRMVEEWRRGAEVVFAVKQQAVTEPAYKRLTARLFYKTMRAMADVDIPAHAQDFRLMSRRTAVALGSMRENHRYLRGLAGWIGFRRAYVEYSPDARFAGETKYSATRMMRLAFDGILSFSTRPLRMAVWVGSLMAALGLAYAAVLVGLRMTGRVDIEGWTSLFVALLVFSGIQLLTIGVVGEYVGRIYEEVRGRPLYLVEDALGFPRDCEEPDVRG